MKKAVVLLSGGLDSATTLAIAKSQGYDCYALSFDYGQKHRAELAASKRVAQANGVAEHYIVPVPLTQWGGSALTNDKIAVPEYREDKNTQEIPSTYVPARNTIFLSIALGAAEAVGAYDIFIGASQVDYSGYPDCRGEYFVAFEHLARLATKKGVEGETFHIHTPLLNLNKAQTILTGLSLGVDYAMTVSCYRADEAGRACGMCDSCSLRKKGFLEAGVKDVTHYI